MDESLSADWLVVVIAAVLNMFINYVWYSRWLFGTQWMSLAKMKESDVKPNARAFILSFIVSLILAYFLSWFELHLGVTTVQDGLFVGFCAWLGFVATTQIGAVIWCKKPLRLFFIESGNRLLSLLVLGGILGA
ncbi:MAG: DUF1761 domain-containing protein [Chlamydiia bacterium]|nr:DUF1761 domain-containing protein [Chlamydiia bacterium]